ncbi:MAG: HAD-IA family hydrolase [Parvularculaceae bacterium]|nr:HAD-IA family hydrolase [Parvularculaceae bacterium]
MDMKALLLGSIGVVAETSDLQRESFNEAFTAAGLDWHWDKATYRDLLKRSGGAQRIEQEALARGVRVNAAAIHAEKSQRFLQKIADHPLEPREGVREALDWARTQPEPVKTAFVSATLPQTVAAILQSTGLTAAFDCVLTSADMKRPAPKPAPHIYDVALSRLFVEAGAAIAVEDNPDGLRAAQAAGIACIAVPGALHDHSEFDGALVIQDHLDIHQALTLLAA